MRSKKLDPLADNSDNNDKTKEETKEKLINSLAKEDNTVQELFSLLEPDTYEIGISEKRIARAKLVCSNIHKYSEEEKRYLVYPTLYQLHLYGYHTVEIGSILGLAPNTVLVYLKKIRQAFKHQFIEDRTGEEIIAETIAHYDFISKESLRLASEALEQNKASFLRLSAQAESEKAKILNDTGYFDMIRRRNTLQALNHSNTDEAMQKDSLLSDIKDIVAEYRIIKEDQ